MALILAALEGHLPAHMPMLAHDLFAFLHPDIARIRVNFLFFAMQKMRTVADVRYVGRTRAQAVG